MTWFSLIHIQWSTFLCCLQFAMASLIEVHSDHTGLTTRASSISTSVHIAPSTMTQLANWKMGSASATLIYVTVLITRCWVLSWLSSAVWLIVIHQWGPNIIQRNNQQQSPANWFAAILLKWWTIPSLHFASEKLTVDRLNASSPFDLKSIQCKSHSVTAISAHKIPSG